MAFAQEEDGSSDADGSPTHSGPTGLLIIRAWLEQGSTEPLRAQIRLSRDVSAGIERTVTVARVGEAVDTVREWLEAILDEGDTGTGQP